MLLLALADPLQLPLECHHALDGLERFSRCGRLAEIKFVKLVPLVVQFDLEIGFLHGFLMPQLGRVFQHEASSHGSFTRAISFAMVVQMMVQNLKQRRSPYLGDVPEHEADDETQFKIFGMKRWYQVLERQEIEEQVDPRCELKASKHSEHHLLVFLRVECEQ